MRTEASAGTGAFPTLTLREVAETVGGDVEGEASLRVRGVAPLEEAGPGDLAFLADRRYLRFVEGCRAQAILVTRELAPFTGAFQGRVVVTDGHQALARLLRHLFPPPPPKPGIHPTAVVASTARLGQGVAVGPYAVVEEEVVVGDRVSIAAHCVLGRGSQVGDDSVLHPHVVLYPGVRVGKRVILHAGVRLGVDGFGYVPGPEGPVKVPQIGGCVVEDDVEMGANTCVDRGSIGRTVVGRGTKLDNLVHLAHNVRIGRRVLMAAMVGVAGSSRVGDDVQMGGQAGVAGHVEVGPGARLAAQAGVIGDVPPGETVSGFPARNHREFFRAMGHLFRMEDLLSRLKRLESRCAAVEEKLGGRGGKDLR